MKKYLLKYGFFSIILLLVCSIFVFVLTSQNFNAKIIPVGATIDESAKVDGHFLIYINRANGGYELVDSVHNVLYDNGKNITIGCLFDGGCAVVKNLSLCNGNVTGGCDVPVADNTGTFTTMTVCGLTSTAGTVTNSGVTGNRTVSYTWTATCDNLLINATRLTNTTGGVFAASTFTLATLQNADQITVNYTSG